MATPSENLEKLGLTLPDAPAPVASYVNCVATGNLLHISGGLPFDSEGNLITGKVPGDVSVEDAQNAAKQVILNRLAVIKGELGSLERVTKVVSISGFVSSGPDFYDHPKVINGASDFLLEIFGDAGKHSRIALGVSALPLNVCVEISMIVEFE